MSSIWVSGEGEHGVVLTQTMHLAGRVARPYNVCVGATLVVALPPQLALRKIRTRLFL